ncbi:unnamed protein product, partial [Arctogadus glacialis]
MLYNDTYLMISALTVDIFPKNIIFAGSLTEHGGQGTSINPLYYPPSISCLPVSGLLNIYISPEHRGTSSHLPSGSLVSQSSSFLQ